MQILITGGYGFLSSIMADFLASLGYEVTLATRNSSLYPKLFSNVRVVNIDWNNIDQFFDRFSNFDQVIHAAGINSKDCLLDPTEAIRFNAQITKKFANSALNFGIKRFIFLSTIHVYSSKLVGNFNEYSSTFNNHPYAKSKLMGEEGIQEVFSKSKEKFLILRLTNVIGPPIHKDLCNSDLLANLLCQQILMKKDIVLRNPFQIRDFISIKYLLNFLKKSLTYKFEQNILNISSGKTFTVKEFADLFNNIALRLYGYKVKINFDATLSESNSFLKIKSNSPFGHLRNDIDSEIKNLFMFFEKHF